MGVFGDGSSSGGGGGLRLSGSYSRVPISKHHPTTVYCIMVLTDTAHDQFIY